MPIAKVEKVIDYREDGHLFKTSKKIKKDLEKRALSKSLRKEFESHGYFLSEKARIISADPATVLADQGDSKWLIEDGMTKYRIDENLIELNILRKDAGHTFEQDVLLKFETKRRNDLILQCFNPGFFSKRNKFVEGERCRVVLITIAGENNVKEARKRYRYCKKDMKKPRYAFYYLGGEIIGLFKPPPPDTSYYGILDIGIPIIVEFPYYNEKPYKKFLRVGNIIKMYGGIYAIRIRKV